MTGVQTRVCAVVSATFGLPVASISGTTGAANTESWDSMNHLHLLVALEAEFDVAFDPEQAIELVSVDAITQALEALGAK